MRNWLIGAAILFAAPAHAGELITNGSFNSAQQSTAIVGAPAGSSAAAVGWYLYNNSNTSTSSEIVESFGGRSNLLHIVTGGPDNGALQNFLSSALSGYADVYVVSGQVRFGAYTNNGGVALGSAFSDTTGAFERLALTADVEQPFTFVALYSYGTGAEFYVDLVSANSEAAITEATAPVPEPATWAMLMVGFGAIGGALRRKKARPVQAYA